MISMSKKWRYFLSHLLGWVLFFTPIIVFVFKRPGGEIDLSAMICGPFLLFVFIYTAIFYFNYLALMPGLYFRKRYLVYGAAVIGLLIAVVYVRPFDKLAYFNQRNNGAGSVMQPGDKLGDANFSRPERKPPRPPGRTSRIPSRSPGLDIVSIVLFFTILSISAALRFLEHWQKAVQQAAIAESEKTKAELANLKAQINPHFLFNTLNSIYSLALEKSDKAPDAIVKLSELMRYVMNDATKQFVLLEKELLYISNYIKLQEARLGDTVYIDFHTEGNIAGKRIAPLILIPFIENAFKYGINPEETSEIKIEILAKGSDMIMKVINKKVNFLTPSGTGIGIQNVRKRLALLYPQKHQLSLDDGTHYFSVTLSINLL